MEGFILDDSNLYIVKAEYFHIQGEAHQATLVTGGGGAAPIFAGMADVEEESELDRMDDDNLSAFYWAHYTPLEQGIDSIDQVRRLAWRDVEHWYDIDEHTLSLHTATPLSIQCRLIQTCLDSLSTRRMSDRALVRRQTSFGSTSQATGGGSYLTGRTRRREDTEAQGESKKKSREEEK